MPSDPIRQALRAIFRFYDGYEAEGRCGQYEGALSSHGPPLQKDRVTHST